MDYLSRSNLADMSMDKYERMIAEAVDLKEQRKKAERSTATEQEGPE